MGVPLELFLSGLALGTGPCLFFCFPILIPFVAGTREGWMKGLIATLIFSVSRLFAYVLLGMLTGLTGELLLRFISQTEFSLYVWIFGGLFISLLGVLILLGEGHALIPSWLPKRFTIEDDLRSLALLGFIVGITPCAPLLGVLTYIALSVESPLVGIYYALSFGLGASITTPLILAGIFAGGAPSLIFKTPRIHKLFKRSCGFILIILGVKQIISQIIGSGYY
ncbi:MAG: sulfite exporter TauE/SafE family protein [Candidatus Bathyarchaeota archaeon]|jgi:sulfite exporter TauE/SafE